MPIRSQKSAFFSEKSITAVAIDRRMYLCLLFIYKRFQLFALFHTQYLKNAGEIMFDRID
jgi:hypothetical protein